MNKIIKDACILFAITLVAGIVLGAVYNITKGPIAEQNEKAKQTAYREVLSDADSFEAIDSEKYSEANLAALVSGLKDTEEDFSKDTAEISSFQQVFHQMESIWEHQFFQSVRQPDLV